MTAFDGPTLRAIRESMGIPLRRIAKLAGMSHGHLSKVERGEYGRPVTPAIMSAYEKACGVNLAEAVAAAVEQGELPAVGRPPRVWRPGQMTELRRRSYNAVVAALSIGGHLGEPYLRLLDATGRPLTPAPASPAEISQLEQVTALVTALDLRYGGGLVSQLAKAVLRWAVPMLEATDVAEPVSVRMHAAISALAHRAGWAAFDVAAHEAARGLYRLALYTAVRAGDPNLRAHVLADIAAQHSFLGYHQDALELVRFAEGDERVDPAVRVVLNGVKARNYAAVGDAEACRRHVSLAEDVHTTGGVATAAGWVATIADPSRMYATTGQAMATLALGAGHEGDLREARKRLTQAIDTLDPDTHARAHALCTARLAQVYMAAGELEPAGHWGRMAAAAGPTIRSVRLDRDLNELRATASRHDHRTTRELIDAIDEAIEAV
jgi:helix-turn-helix protein